MNRVINNNKLTNNQLINEIATPLVSISCFTFNHAKYIRDALDGFLIQKTNFPFEILIHDDASTDGTAEIIKEYEQKRPDLFRVIFQKENQFSKGRLNELMLLQRDRAKGKYYAVCEGDDYWIDPLKLQKQVDFLEQNPDYGVVYTDFYIHKEGKEFSLQSTNTQFFSGNVLNELIHFNFINNLTACYKKDLLNQIDTDGISANRFKMGDYPLWLEFAKITKIGFLNDKTSVYRILKESLSHSGSFLKKEDFVLETLRIRLYYVEKFNIGTVDKKKLFLNAYIILLNESIYLGEYGKTREYARKIKELNIREGFKNKIKFLLKDFLTANKMIFRFYSKYMKHKLKNIKS